jgi:hypothetical protein
MNANRKRLAAHPSRICTAAPAANNYLVKRGRIDLYKP